MTPPLLLGTINVIFREVVVAVRVLGYRCLTGTLSWLQTVASAACWPETFILYQTVPTKDVPNVSCVTQMEAPSEKNPRHDLALLKIVNVWKRGTCTNMTHDDAVMLDLRGKGQKLPHYRTFKSVDLMSQTTSTVSVKIPVQGTEMALHQYHRTSRSFHAYSLARKNFKRTCVFCWFWWWSGCSVTRLVVTYMKLSRWVTHTCWIELLQVIFWIAFIVRE